MNKKEGILHIENRLNEQCKNDIVCFKIHNYGHSTFIRIDLIRHNIQNCIESILYHKVSKQLKESLNTKYFE